MKRVALVFAVLAVLVLADGLFMVLSNYQPGDQDPLFGNPRFIISDGTTTLIAGGMLIAVAVIMWLAAGSREQRRQPAARTGQGHQRRS
jgi:hypothetical protein